MGQLYHNWLNKWHRSRIWIHFSRLYDVSFGAFTMSHFDASKFEFFFKNHNRISLRKNAHLLLSKSHVVGAWSASEISKSSKTDLLSWWWYFPIKSRDTWMILGNNGLVFVSNYTLMYVHSFKTHLTYNWKPDIAICLWRVAWLGSLAL